MRSPRMLMVCLLAGTLVGCGDGEVKPTIEQVVPVSGTLTFQGKPLENYQVTFVPADGKRRPAVGTTDASGRFALGTNDRADGACPGLNKVAVAFAPPASDDSTSASPIDDSALLPKPKVEIPTKYASPETSGLTQEVPPRGLSDLKLDLQ